MIQDISPYKFHNEYINSAPDEECCIIFVNEGRVLVKEENGNLSFPAFKDAGNLKADYIYLFSVDKRSFFLAFDFEQPPEGKYKYYTGRELYKAKPEHMAFAAIVGIQLAHWYDDNRYCGRCGKSLHRDDRERMMKCDNCGNSIYPKISPAVIVGIINGDKILMTKYADREYKRYALIAGFTEIGETIEETVDREVMEEVGLRVKNLRYYKSQPWPYSESVLMGFFCELDGDDEITIDRKELSLAEWVSRDDIDIKLDGISLTNEMIVKFKEDM